MNPLAHGIGGRHDLPIPLFYAVGGAAGAVFVSFLVLGLLWAAPRFRGEAAGWPLPRAIQDVADGPALRWTLRIIGIAMSSFVVVAAVFGPDGERNPTAGPARSPRPAR